MAIGKPEAALASVAAGLKADEKMGGSSLEAELYRLKGEALLAGAGTVSEAEAAIEKGIDVARRQNAKSWELRGAMSLARLRRQQGRPQEAVALLAPVYGWFTEGFDTADLKEAKTLLDMLTEPAIAAEGQWVQAPPGAPLCFRQLSQWHHATDSGCPVATKRTAPQRQLPSN